MLIIILLLLILIAVVVALLLRNNNSDSSPTPLDAKSLFASCANSFECPTGFHCELRDHPSMGICVIPPGGACHTVANKDGVCYSGYTCDKQDGICVK